jgi:hypothetical protein
MELVINIPEKLACEGFERTFTEEEKNVLIKAIGNGIPLPKGHGRLIDAGVLAVALAQIDWADTIVEADKGE